MPFIVAVNDFGRYVGQAAPDGGASGGLGDSFGPDGRLAPFDGSRAYAAANGADGRDASEGAAGVAGIGGRAGGGAGADESFSASAGAAMGSGAIAAPLSGQAETLPAHRPLAVAPTYAGDAAREGEATPGSKPDASAAPAMPATGKPLRTVRVIVDGLRHTFDVPSGTLVSDMLRQNGIAMSEDDYIKGADLSDEIVADTDMEVLRVTYKAEEVEEGIRYDTVYKDDPDVPAGTTKTAVDGVDGLRFVTYRVRFVDGIEDGREVDASSTLIEPVDRVVLQGTGPASKTINGNTFRYTQRLKVRCTAYTSSYEDTGKRPGDPAFGITKSGTKARKGVVAVDPDVIPLGSKLYIDIIADGAADYGYASAEDTGRLIKGNKVDLYFDADRETLLEFGVREAYVYVLYE